MTGSRSWAGVCIAASALLAAPAFGQSFVRLTPVGTVPRDRFDSAITTIVEQPDAPGTLWLTLQGGGIHRLNTATGAVSPAMLTLPAYGGGETGLLGMAFHPDFAANSRFYVYYSHNIERQNLLSEFTVDRANPDVIPASSERPLLRLGQPAFHNGGWIGFGHDGFLYLSRGDGGSVGAFNLVSQDPTSLLGKLLRLDVDRDDFPDDPARNYGIPADNPFAHGRGAGEVWAVGLRNAWRCSFDRETGDLWIGDVGDNAFEEIDRAPASQAAMNFGWPCFEGDHHRITAPPCDRAQDMTPPVLTYARATGAAVTGGFVYRGEALPRLRGAYLFADYVQQRLSAFEHGTVRRINVNAPPLRITTFGEDDRGELYVTGRPRTVYRLDCGADFNGDAFVDFFDILAYFDCFEGVCPTDHSADVNGDGFLDFFDAMTFLDAFELGC